VTVGTELDMVVDELRDAERLLLITHENPDGDALGSILGMHGVLRLLGKDVLMFMPADQFPLPHEYKEMPFDGVITEPPPDMTDRLVVFLDCGNADRMPVDFIAESGARIVNIDHHHDNTRFGSVNLVVPHASCTAEIVYGLSKQLGVEVTPPIAEALYVGLITDTGKFMYQNTTPEAHRMAAELIEIGVDVQAVYRRLYENLPWARLQLLSRALNRISRYDDGRITVTHLRTEDFRETGSQEEDSEGIVDHIRSIEGTAVAVLVRELLAADRAGRRKVSLRAPNGAVDVSRIAREMGGGGHRQAAGFSTALPLPELLERLRREVGEQLD